MTAFKTTEGAPIVDRGSHLSAFLGVPMTMRLPSTLTTTPRPWSSNGKKSVGSRIGLGKILSPYPEISAILTPPRPGP